MTEQDIATLAKMTSEQLSLLTVIAVADYRATLEQRDIAGETSSTSEAAFREAQQTIEQLTTAETALKATIDDLAKQNASLNAIEKELRDDIERQKNNHDAEVIGLWRKLAQHETLIVELSNTIETMAGHPDVIAARIAREKASAEEALRQANTLREEAEAKLATLEDGNQ
jgi:cell division protein FtsB